jgi:hypothetical protein
MSHSEPRLDQDWPVADRQLRVYIPREGTSARAAVAEHAGVVGTPLESGRVLLDYEANFYDAANIRTFADKVHHAAGRHTARYPTRARTEVDATSVIEIGTYEGGSITIYPEERALLARWLQVSEDVLEAECRRSE